MRPYKHEPRGCRCCWPATARRSPRGGQTAAALFSFTSTCQRLGVEPWAYLQDVLTRLPTAPAGQLGDLLPDHWQAARQVSRPMQPASTSEKPPPAAQPAY